MAAIKGFCSECGAEAAVDDYGCITEHESYSGGVLDTEPCPGTGELSLDGGKYFR